MRESAAEGSSPIGIAGTTIAGGGGKVAFDQPALWYGDARGSGETGLTPAKYVERARVDAARRLLEDGEQGLETVASRCGFGSGEQMRRTFLRHVGVVPIDYRRRFQMGPERRAS